MALYLCGARIANIAPDLPPISQEDCSCLAALSFLVD